MNSDIQDQMQTVLMLELNQTVLLAALLDLQEQVMGNVYRGTAGLQEKEAECVFQEQVSVLVKKHVNQIERSPNVLETLLVSERVLLHRAIIQKQKILILFVKL